MKRGGESQLRHMRLTSKKGYDSARYPITAQAEVTDFLSKLDVYIY